MQTPFAPKSLLKSLCVLAVFSVGVGAAHAGNDDPCFEDGLKNPWTAPVPAIHVDHHSGQHGWGHAQHDWHFNPKHDGWQGWGNHGSGSGSGNGGIGVSPIPEPQTEAMLLAGLVMLASLVRRKSKTGGR